MKKLSVFFCAMLLVLLGICSTTHATDYCLCAKIDKKTGDLKEGSNIKLRSACKRGEVAIGSTEELASIRANTAFRRLGLKLSNTERDRKALVDRFRVERNDITARLSEIYATATAGNNVVYADPDLALSSIQDIINEVEDILDGLTLFNEETIVSNDTVFAPEVVAAATLMNDWIADAQTMATNMMFRLQLSLARFHLSQMSGDPVPVGIFVENLARSLENLRVQMGESSQSIAIATELESLSYVTQETFSEELYGVADDAELADVDLQNMLQKQQQTLQAMSNVSKQLHDTAMAIIRKIG